MLPPPSQIIGGACPPPPPGPPSSYAYGLCACTVGNPLAKARGLSIRTGAQTMLYLPQKGRHTFKGVNFVNLSLTSFLKEVIS